jgi:cobaltochelatase CobS
MQENELIRQVIETIRKDIVTDKKFMSALIGNIKLTPENIPNETIIQMMNQLGNTQQLRQPVSNQPKDMKGTKVAKPISIGADSNEVRIVSDLLDGNNVYLMGKAGTGKTYLAKAIAQSVMGQPVFQINCSQWTSPIEIRGGQTIKGYEEGLLIKAWAQGGILILDELPKLDPNTAGILNDALSETASQPKYDEDGKVIESTIPSIVNGRGQKILKGQDAENPELKYRFSVIATGNTDMMNVGNKYGGNQRQDYSLVDRFAGSFYTIDVDPTKEKSLTYPYVYDVCNAIRGVLDKKADAMQSISLRTMLNFNRTFEQQMLYSLPSELADIIYNNNGQRIPPKTIQNSIDSFLSMCEKNLQDAIRNDQAYRDATSPEAFVNATEDFEEIFKCKYHLHPKTGKVLTNEEIAKLNCNK